jgi:Inorganic pyrophosphatase.
MQEIKRWFKVIKTFDRKPINEIAFNEKIFDQEKTIEVIFENHEFWKQLREVSGNVTKYEAEYGKKLLKIAKEFHMSG